MVHLMLRIGASRVGSVVPSRSLFTAGSQSHPSFHHSFDRSTAQPSGQQRPYSTRRPSPNPYNDDEETDFQSPYRAKCKTGQRRTSPPPPPREQPETIMFDKPAIPNPGLTAENHARFRKNAKRAAIAGAGILSVVAVYAAYNTAYADDGSSSEAAPPSTSGFAATPTSPKDAIIALQRTAVITSAVVLCMLDYRRTMNRKYESKQDEVEQLRQCHLRSAHRVLRALQQNGGLFIKLGQHLSSIILLPPEWTRTLTPLQDQNKPTPLKDFEPTFIKETGMTFDEAFEFIDSKPVGVASLAQVHRAIERRRPGEPEVEGEPMELAIKMLHPKVEKFSAIDMKTVNVLVGVVKRIFPEFEFTWLAEEMNTNMPLELDFQHEAYNALRAKADFEQYQVTSCYVPAVRWAFKRNMAIEFIHGRRPDDLDFLAKHNIDRNRVSQELSRIFAQMVYIHGFFHADPHGGNVLIQPAAPGKQRSWWSSWGSADRHRANRKEDNQKTPYNFRIVLLDHGLYYELPNDLRLSYARFWLSLLSRGTPQVQASRRKYAKEIANIGDDLYPILESAITGRAGLVGSDPNNPDGVKGRQRASSILEMQGGSEMTSDEQEHIRTTVMQKEGLFLDILSLLRVVPRPMLMILKLNDLMRSLDASLHTTHGSTRPFVIAARYCARAVWAEEGTTLFSSGHIHVLSTVWWSRLRDSYGPYVYFNYGLALIEAFSDLWAGWSNFVAFGRGLVKGRGRLDVARSEARGQGEARRAKEEGERVRGEIEREGREEEDGKAMASVRG
ncbi:hypothetical protein A4X06_0g3981 [Tilletia controversa]|uniref:ABC1 atypical kinase-like domain-containing protein n=1 Tax=Tilletia controversa TaxID=13291 RepID=A0A8X7MT34_9BASI|nr:hypothetical protein CF328_g523 [Tilletia controversa]KAE8248069.1 hypothetical protein A4X06_0g3981 [Tilletia controversa]